MSVCTSTVSHAQERLVFHASCDAFPRSLADLLIRTIRFPTGSGEARLQTGISWKVGILPQRSLIIKTRESLE